jgi:hypothetical protein
MNEAGENSTPRFDGSYEGTRHRQVLLGLSMTPHQRLRWLENRMAEMRRFLGKAGRAPETETR